MSGTEGCGEPTGDHSQLSDEWQRDVRLSEIVAAARQLAVTDREVYLAQACAQDCSLQADAAALLKRMDAAASEPSASTVTEDPEWKATVTCAGGREGTPPRVGNYRIEGEIGKGGMGVVYRGFDEKLGRRVAIKAVPPALLQRPEFRVRLEREARLLAFVSHPNIATIFDLEENSGQLYLILEYIEGETLAKRLARGPLEIGVALATCLKIAQGLDSAHRRGVVHRDVKPANVMLTTDGLVKLLDFGLAKVAVDDDLEPGVQTRAGRIVGTPGYMSPEQEIGDAGGPATDIWSFGCVLYECLTGERLWRVGSAAEPQWQIHTHSPDLGRLPPTLSPEIVDLLRRCLETDPRRRPRDLREVIEVLKSTTTANLGVAVAARSDRRRGNLTPERDSFVGRTRELSDLGARLATGNRLLTVLGSGGTGKTRLMQHYGLENGAAWPGGVWFCDLAEARSVDGILNAVATALDVPLGRDPVTQLGDVIADRGRCLIILDNFEQAIAHAPATLGRWLDRAPEAVFVVTSRVRLDLAGEQLYPLEPLEVEEEGVALFAVRANAQLPAFTLTTNNRGVVADVVRMVDSLPLAIELAAARVRVLSVEQIRDRLSDRFGLLTGGNKGSRQASLAATFDWSWSLLRDWEQAMLAQLSVFDGGFTLEAAEAVVELGSWPEAPSILDVLQLLIDRSLVRITLPDGNLRFSMLVSVQAYGRAKLVSGIARPGNGVEAAVAVEVRHAHYFARFGSDAAVDALERSDGTARRTALGHEVDNLVAACRRATKWSEHEIAVRNLVAAWEVLRMCGPMQAGLELASPLAESEALETSLRAHALFVLAAASWSLGRLEDARQRSYDCLQLARSVGDRRCEARMLSILGHVQLEMGDVEQALEQYEIALALAKASGERGQQGHFHNRLGGAHLAQGRADTARGHYESALEIAREVGDRVLEGGALCNLATVERIQGRPEQCRLCLNTALIIVREVGNRTFEVNVLESLAVDFQFNQGLLDQAQRHYNEALVIARSIGNRATIARLLGNLARVLIDGGQPHEALVHAAEYLAIARKHGFRRYEAYALSTLGNVYLDLAQTDLARQHLTDGLAIGREFGDPILQGDVLAGLGVAAARESRHDEACTHFAEGAALLRSMGQPVELGMLLCRSGEFEWLTGDHEAARLALAEAETVATVQNVQSKSDLGTAVAALKQKLAD